MQAEVKAYAQRSEVHVVCCLKVLIYRSEKGTCGNFWIGQPTNLKTQKPYQTIARPMHAASLLNTFVLSNDLFNSRSIDTFGRFESTVS